VAARGPPPEGFGRRAGNHKGCPYTRKIRFSWFLGAAGGMGDCVENTQSEIPCSALAEVTSFSRKRESSPSRDVDPRLRGGDEKLTFIPIGEPTLLLLLRVLGWDVQGIGPLHDVPYFGRVGAVRLGSEVLFHFCIGLVVGFLLDVNVC